jgi:ADP-heptose:LPS heptosyltransferase
MPAIPKKVLLIRLDKIGDLICTLPADQILDSHYYDVTWVVQKGMGQIIDLGDRKRKYIEIDKSSPQSSRKIFAEFLKKNNFDIAVSFQCPWWINWEIFKAGIKKRIGVLSQWHSFLFLDEGIRQKRSQAIKHEFDYNLDLVAKVTGPVSEEVSSKLFFKLKKPNSSEILQKYNLPMQYTVIHPGMMGSALNWNQEKYIDYINQQLLLNKTIVITGTPADEPYLYKIRLAFSQNSQVIWLQSKLNMRELTEVLYFSEKVIAPSTGVAHIAASLDKIVYGLYSPIQVHHQTRWAPRGRHVTVFMPLDPCPAQFKCLGATCKFFNCMDKVTLPD